jgi:uncharacterized repeat protein (TIGR02543 family)
VTAVFEWTQTNWWNTAWKYRRTITIDHTKVSGDQANFPVLIDLIDSGLTSKARTDGYDFVFTDANQVKLSHEIEIYDSATGHLIAWVKIPLLSSTSDTVLYLYYGNPSSGNQQDINAVWDTSYKLVLHLDETSGTHYDSTVNGNNGTPYNGVIQGTSGKIDGADVFDGSNAYIQVAHSASLAGYTEAFTVSFWLKLEDTSRRQTILGKYNTGTNQRSWFVDYNPVDRPTRPIGFYASYDGTNYREWYANFVPSANTWYHLTVVWETNTIPKFYINGAQVATVGTATISQIYNNVDVPLLIGRCQYNNNRYFKGALDEIRISNPARSAGYILTSYNNQLNPTAFYTIGTEEQWVPPHYTLTINIVGQGTVTKDPNQITYPEGTLVKLTANADLGWTFQGWSGDITSTDNPVEIIMDGNKVITATFTQDQYTLTLDTNGNGHITKSPDQATYTYGTVVTLEAVPDAGWTFAGWSGDLTGTTNPTTITMTGNKEVTATFTQLEYTLSVTADPPEGGSVNVNPAGPYHYGDIVQLEVVPTPGWYFAGWSGDLSGSESPTNITIDGNKAVTAMFIKIGFTLTINVVGSGEVTISPNQPTYDLGTEVTLTANPAPGWSFDGWSGDLGGSDNPATITMDSNKVITATFTQDQYTLDITIVGNGQVTKNPDQLTYTYGTIVTLNADADPGWIFDVWGGDLSGSENPKTITIDGNKVVTATFTQDHYTLTINIVGSGSVTRSPDQTTYTYGTVVTLTAVPETGWLFSQWSGDLTGSTNPTTITMTGNKAITATFTRLLVDSELSESSTSEELRANAAGQDWYESRHYFSGGDETLLTLNTANIGGNEGKKACLDSSTVFSNAYMTQEFSSLQSGTFTVSYDIYIDKIVGYSTYNRAGGMYIGDDRITTNCPTGTSNERFLALVFYDPTPGDTGNDLEIRALSGSATWSTTTTWLQITYGLSYDTWYTIKLVINVAAGTYDIYVNGVQVKTNVPKYNGYTNSTVYYISFSADSEGRGLFYVDNVHSPALDRYRLTVNTVGNGSVTKTPGESTYAPSTLVTLTAVPASGWTFSGWSGDLSSSDNPATIIMDSNKIITATFTSEVPPLGIEADFDSASIGTYTILGNQIDFEMVTETLTTGEIYTYWTYFKVTNTQDREVTFRITNAAEVPFLTITTQEAQLVYSYDGVNWFRITTHSYSGGIYTFTQTFTSNEAYIATFYPFSYTEMRDYLNTVDASPWAEKTILGSSEQGRDVALLKITNPAIPDTGKKVIYIIGRQHSAETCSSYMLQGMIDFLISDNADAQRMRDAFVWYIVPMVNPDGVYLGKSRGTSENRNANRDWMNTETVEINLIREHIILIDTTYGIDFFIDWHSQMDDTSWYNYVYSPPENTFFSILSAWTDFDTQFASTPGTGSENDCTARQYISWSIIYDPMFVFEPTPHLSTWTISSLRQQGVNVAYAIDQYTTYTLDVIVDGSGSVTKNPNLATYTYGTSVKLNATADTGWSFSHWSGALTGSDNPATLVITGDTTVTAHFTQNQYTLSITVDGNGSVTKNPDQPTYTYGTMVELTATAEAGWTFSHWSGDASGTFNPTTVIIDGDKSVTAVFTQSQYTLSINIIGSGSVTKTPDHAVYAHGETVTLTATPEAGWSFSGWSGDLTSSQSPIDIVMDSSKSITATFTQDQYTLAVTIVGSGTVSKSPDQATFIYGASVQLTATANIGWSFSGWSGDLTGSDNPATVTIIGNTEITATFTQDQYTLTLNIVGQGSVNKNPDQATYTYGTEVQLNATPNSGWKFSGWSGDLSGSTNPATITMDRSKSVTATFLQILLVDSNFDNSIDDADLRADGPGQDWYESRKDGVNGPTYLTLDESNVAGNTGKKAKITGTLSYNTYLSQQFNAQTGTFTVQFDIYYDALLNRASGEDRGAFICIGYEDPTGTNGPCSTGNERFVYLAIVKDGGAQTGPVALVWKNQAGTSTSIGNVNLDQWYTMKITVKVASNLYDVQVYDGSTLVLEKLNIPAATSGISPTHICFESWNDGAATFYVDNVFAPAELANENLFTLIVLPDTQYYSQSYLAIFANQTQWIVNNVAKMNILFVLHEGDLVQNSDDIAQWINANTSMSLLDGNVPWAVLPGNHDGTDVGGLSEDLTNYNTYFSYSRFSGETWYGGAYNNINTNSFLLFSSGEDDYIIFCFQYHPSDAVLAWANTTLAAYPDRRAIIVTHDYLNLDGTRTTEGNHIWNNFIVHHADQIFLVLCGHMHGEARRQDTVNGYIIYQLLADYQERENGGNGWLRILEFHTAGDKIYVKTFSPYLNSYEIDADSQFVLGYDMPSQKAQTADQIDQSYIQNINLSINSSPTMTPLANANPTYFSTILALSLVFIIPIIFKTKRKLKLNRFSHSFFCCSTRARQYHV